MNARIDAACRIIYCERVKIALRSFHGEYRAGSHKRWSASLPIRGVGVTAPVADDRREKS